MCVFIYKMLFFNKIAVLTFSTYSREFSIV